MIVSVVLPFRNAESTLGSAIQSILDQTFEEFELILVNNASTDNSVEVVHSIKDPRIRLVNEPKVGVVHAANRGLKEAKGDYIARMDADDWSAPTRLKRQVELLVHKPEIGLVSGIVENLGEPTAGFKQYLDWVNQVRSPEQIFLNQFVEYPIVNPSIMFRRDLINRFGDYKCGDFPEDYEFFLRLSTGGVRMQKVNEVVLKWNDLPCRLTRTHPSYSEEAFNKIKSNYLASWLKKNNQFDPQIWVWGAGKQARKRSSELESHGIQILGYIDVSRKERSGDLPVIHFDDLPDLPDRFIVSYVSNWGARDEIKAYLKGRNWREGMDFILAG